MKPAEPAGQQQEGSVSPDHSLSGGTEALTPGLHTWESGNHGHPASLLWS